MILKELYRDLGRETLAVTESENKVPQVPALTLFSVRVITCLDTIF